MYADIGLSLCVNFPKLKSILIVSPKSKLLFGFTLNICVKLKTMLLI